jgi:hypothetical protein
MSQSGTHPLIARSTSLGLLLNKIRRRLAQNVQDHEMFQQFEGYEVQFETVLLNNDLQHSFQKFCATMNQQYSVQFILAVSQFTKSNNLTEQINLLLHIVDEYISPEGKNIPIDDDFKRHILDQVHLSGQRSNRTSLRVDTNIFDHLYESIAQQLKTDIFPMYIRSDEFHTLVTVRGKTFIYGLIDPSLNHNLSMFDLQHLLRIPFLHDALYKFSTSEHSEENIDLYDQIQKYKKVDESTRQDFAVEIYEKYVKAGADYEANLSSKVRVELRDHVHEATPYLYDNAAEELARTCIYDIYVRFANSPDFDECKKAYLNGLVVNSQQQTLQVPRAQSLSTLVSKRNKSIVLK